MSMHIEQIRQLLSAQPFQPFQVHLADGRSVSVPHPEFAWVTPGGRTIFVSDGAERVHRIDALLVTSLSDPETGSR